MSKYYCNCKNISIRLKEEYDQFEEFLTVHEFSDDDKTIIRSKFPKFIIGILQMDPIFEYKSLVKIYNQNEVVYYYCHLCCDTIIFVFKGFVVINAGKIISESQELDNFSVAFGLNLPSHDVYLPPDSREDLINRYSRYIQDQEAEMKSNIEVYRETQNRIFAEKTKRSQKELEGLLNRSQDKLNISRYSFNNSSTSVLRKSISQLTQSYDYMRKSDANYDSQPKQKSRNRSQTMFDVSSSLLQECPRNQVFEIDDIDTKYQDQFNGHSSSSSSPLLSPVKPQMKKGHTGDSPVFM